MQLSPQYIIFLVVSKYLGIDEVKSLKTEFTKYKRISSQKFIEIIEIYFAMKVYGPIFALRF